MRRIQWLSIVPLFLAGCGVSLFPGMELVGKSDVPMRELVAPRLRSQGPTVQSVIFRSREDVQAFITQNQLQELGISYGELEALDYDRETGLLATYTTPGTCGGVEIAAIDDEGSALMVYIIQRRGSGVCGQVVTTHTHFVAIAKTDKPIRFASPLVVQ